SRRSGRFTPFHSIPARRGFLMKCHRVLKALAALAALALVAVLVPASPLYLPTIVNWNGDYGGHSTSYWIDSLDSSDDEARRRAIFALGAIGAGANDAVPALAAI